MNLKNLNDQTLLQETANLVQEEREVLTSVLYHLREIERRRLFSSQGYGSLFEYAVKSLKYSDDQAYRRIAAMRLIKEMPEVVEKIESGRLTLSNASQAYSLFRQERKSAKAEFTTVQKREVINRLENKSARDGKNIIFSFSTIPHKIPAEKVKPVAKDTLEYSFCVSRELDEKIQKLKALRAHTFPGISMEDLINQLCDLGLEKWNPLVVKKNEKKLAGSKKRREVQNIGVSEKPSNLAPEKNESKKSPWTSQKRSVNVRRFIPIALKKKIWRDAGGKCHICQSDYALQIDHILPIAKNGGNSADNLRLLCRSCNQRVAIEHFGVEKMAPYFD